MSLEGWNLGVALGQHGADRERKYTLDEAKRELALRECGYYGHSYDVLTMAGHNEPAQVVCGRCGASWEIAERPS